MNSAEQIEYKPENAHVYLSEEQKEYVETLKKNREEYSSEYMRPKYHFYAPIGKMNDPNGLCYWNGNWHLFYQNNACDKGWWWGHAVSEDLIHWTDLPLAVWAEKEKCCWQQHGTVVR